MLHTANAYEDAQGRIVLEGPTLNDELIGAEHRYQYAVSFPDHNGFGCYGIVKYDRLTGDRRIHQVRDARLPSEAAFVPAAGATNEDDGYLLTVISDVKQDASHLDRIATVHLPRRVTAGIHGSLTSSLAAASSRARAAALRSHDESTFCDMIGSS